MTSMQVTVIAREREMIYRKQKRGTKRTGLLVTRHLPYLNMV
jgi:hypothetical protein